MSAAVRVVDKAVGFVADSAMQAVEGALKDPLGTILTIGAVVAAPATGGASLAWLPAVKAGVVIAKGGSIEDAAKSAAISYAVLWGISSALMVSPQSLIPQLSLA